MDEIDEGIRLPYYLLSEGTCMGSANISQGSSNNISRRCLAAICLATEWAISMS
jgi:hypothetical protein